MRFHKKALKSLVRAILITLLLSLLTVVSSQTLWGQTIPKQTPGPLPTPRSEPTKACPCRQQAQTPVGATSPIPTPSPVIVDKGEIEEEVSVPTNIAPAPKKAVRKKVAKKQPRVVQRNKARASKVTKRAKPKNELSKRRFEGRNQALLPRQC
ncbi:MAG: hypothetical protein R3B41_01680 [Candidatus Doudnabacteria bacterium]